MTTGSVNGVHDWRADAATSLAAMRAEIEASTEAVRVAAIQRSLRHIDERAIQEMRDAAIPPYPQMEATAERTAAAVTAAQQAHLAAVRQHAEITAAATAAAETAWSDQIAAADPGTPPSFAGAEESALSAAAWEDVTRRINALAVV